jgi:acetyl esterase/lipase
MKIRSSKHFGPLALASLAFGLMLTSSVKTMAADATDSSASDASSTKSFVYKHAKQGDLELLVDYPPNWRESDHRPAIVFFFGGGWQNGSTRQFEPQATYLAGRGLVAVRADYRVKARQDVTPKECVEDAKSAMRWVRKNATTLGIDPDRIIAAGGSAGGHLAACTFFTPGLDAEGEETSISCKPCALVLFNPVLRFDNVPSLMERIGDDEVLGKAISPTVHLTKDAPPTIMFYGTDDKLMAQGEEYMKRMHELGRNCELFKAEGQRHSFFNRAPWQERTLARADEFLASLGYLDGTPTLKVP